MKRRWFQIHLSTLLLGVLATGTFLGMQFSKYGEYLPNGGTVTSYLIGWPCFFADASSKTGLAWRVAEKTFDVFDQMHGSELWTFLGYLTVDMLAFLGCIIGICGSAELFIRRREARKP